MENGKDILIVEDSDLQAEGLSEILTRRGYSVRRVKDGLEGLYALQESQPKLIISDVWMPRMNGYEFCRTVKDDVKLRHIPLILLTSLADMADIVKGLNAGADYYFTKPYSEPLLLSMVYSVLARPNAPEDNDGQTFEASIKGEVFTLHATSSQVFNFLTSTYENLLNQNRNLAQTKRDLKILNDHLEERVKEKTSSIERTLNGVVAALATAVDMRDPYTAGHQVRVSRLACAISEAMGLSKENTEGIGVMGFLHDIGKIIVPAEILSKPSRLTDYEFVFIKAHVRAGHDILKGIEFPWPVATAVAQHHERINGSGYPSGLTGNEIIREAKILAVADVIESMASHRPYRPALGIDAALEEISMNSGILYDPEAAGASLRLFRQQGFTLDV